MGTVSPMSPASRRLPDVLRPRPLPRRLGVDFGGGQRAAQPCPSRAGRPPVLPPPAVPESLPLVNVHQRFTGPGGPSHGRVAGQPSILPRGVSRLFPELLGTLHTEPWARDTLCPRAGVIPRIDVEK